MFYFYDYFYWRFCVSVPTHHHLSRICFSRSYLSVYHFVLLLNYFLLYHLQASFFSYQPYMNPVRLFQHGLPCRELVSTRFSYDSRRGIQYAYMTRGLQIKQIDTTSQCLIKELQYSHYDLSLVIDR